MTGSVPRRRALLLRGLEGATQTSEIHPLWLRFSDPELDRVFRHEDDQAAVPQVVLAGVLAVVLYAGFGILDAFAVPGDVVPLLVIRFAIVCPLLLLGIMLLVRMPHLAPVLLQPGVCLIVVVASYGLVIMPFVADTPVDYSRTGTLLILLYLFAFARVRFLWALATTVVVIVGYEVATIGQGISWADAVYNNFFLLGFVVIGASASYSLERLRRLEFLRERALEQERTRSDRLLHNVLPEEIASRLRTEPTTIAESADDVSVLFADIVGFTPLAEALSPNELVKLLDGLFTVFDDLCAQHGVEKIKTIGDAYMVVAGVPRPDPDHAASIAELALDMQDAAALFADQWPGPLALRIGISSGPVVAGVIGHTKFAFDLWGDTVNTASRMEAHGAPGRIQVSASTHALLRDLYTFGERQAITVKGKGEVDTYVLRGRIPDVSNSEGVVGVG